MIKYTKSVLWRVAKRLSYIQDARCLKVKAILNCGRMKEHDVRNTVYVEKDLEKLTVTQVVRTFSIICSHCILVT